MSKTLIILAPDSPFLRGRNRDLSGFRLLPLALENPSLSLQEADIKRRIANYPEDHIRFFSGLDWMLGKGIDVLNISLGPMGFQYDESDPYQIVTKYVHKIGIPVVVAAGNDGPALNTLQPLARAPWVISVGATDQDRKLLQNSSRGAPGGIHPTVVSLGLSYFMLQEDFKKPEEWIDYSPATSFAAPWVSKITACLYKCLELIFHDVKAITEKTWPTMSSPFRLPHVGIPDTGFDPKYLPERSPCVQSILKTGSNSIILSRSTREQQWYNELFLNLKKWGITCDITQNPDIVRRLIESIATEMEDYEEYEVGAGYVSLDELRTFLQSFTPSRFVELFSRYEINDMQRFNLLALDGILGPLWDDRMVFCLMEYFYNGIIIVVADIY